MMKVAHRAAWAVAAALLSMAAPVMAQQPPAGGSNTGPGTVPGIPPYQQGPLFYAQAPIYGNCSWTLGGDVGPCINSAIAACATANGGTVLIPAGQFGWATEIVNNTSGCKLVGAGLGNPRDTVTPTHYLAVTRLVWNGAAGAATGVLVAPANGDPEQELYSVDVVGIVFDGASLLNNVIEITQAAYSTFNFGCAEARVTCIWGSTLLSGGEAPGWAHNDVWLYARNVSASYNATGILLDGRGGWGVGGTFNVSLNRFHHLEADYAGGDGIVFGYSDTNKIGSVYTYHYGSATSGSPLVFANNAYVPPSGVAVAGYSYDNKVEFASSPVDFGGFTTNSIWTPNGGNTGAAALNTTTISTNAPSGVGSSVLNFASTTGVSVNQSVNCGGASSGVYPGALVRGVTPTTVTISSPVVAAGGVSGVGSGLSCKFSYAASQFAVAGTYTITAASSTTWNITAPAGGHSQSGISISAGLVSFQDVIIPITGTPVTNDSFTLVVSAASTKNVVQFIDKANNITDPFFEAGSSGWYTTPNSPMPIVTSNFSGYINAFGGSQLGISMPSTATGLGASAFGSFNTASSNQATSWFGFNNTASGNTAMTLGGANNTASGTEGVVVGGQRATDRARYNSKAWASGEFATQGDAQTSEFVLRCTVATSGGTCVVTGDQAAAGSANCVNIPNNTAYTVRVSLVAIDHTTPGNNWSWVLPNGILTRGANAASTAWSGGTPGTLSNGTVTAIGFAITADATNGCMTGTFTHPTGNADTWNVVAKVETVEVQ